MTLRTNSLEAYEAVKKNGVLNKSCFEVYEAIAQLGGASTEQAGRRVLEKVGGERKANPNIHPRILDLEEMGMVKDSGRFCINPSGQRAAIWEITDRVIPLEDKRLQLKTEEMYNGVEDLKTVIDDYRSMGGKISPECDLLMKWLDQHAALRMKRAARADAEPAVDEPLAQAA